MKIYVELSYGSVVGVYTDDNNNSVDVVVCDNDMFTEITSRPYEGKEDNDFDEMEAGEKEYNNLGREEREIVDNVLGLSMQRRNLKKIYGYSTVRL